MENENAKPFKQSTCVCTWGCRVGKTTATFQSIICGIVWIYFPAWFLRIEMPPSSSPPYPPSMHTADKNMLLLRLAFLFSIGGLPQRKQHNNLNNMGRRCLKRLLHTIHHGITGCIVLLRVRTNYKPLMPTISEASMALVRPNRRRKGTKRPQDA